VRDIVYEFVVADGRDVQFWKNHNLPYWDQCASTTSC
jgi:hypothetical protein